MMDLQNISEDEKYLLGRVSDAFVAADTQNRVKMVGFLDERQQELVKAFAARRGYTRYCLFGGYEGASRKVLGVFPDYVNLEQPPDSLFDIVKVITVSYRPEDSLCHRDFLGALMGLNITRESLGDILVGEGLAVLFVLHPVTQVILDELVKVGRVGVRCSPGLPEQLPREERFLEIKDTVSSMRLDSIVAVLARCSREKAAQLVRQGLVTHNYEPVQQVSRPVAQGDKLSIRGCGKFIVDQAGGLTKKGRVQLVCKKYL